MEPKPKIGEIRAAVKENEKLVQQFRTEEETWGVYDSRIDSFEARFFTVLPDKYTQRRDSFKDYIEETLRGSENLERTAVEFGGPGSVLFRGFTRGFFSKTVGVCLKDLRPPNIKGVDGLNHHSVLEGDIFDRKNSVTEKVAKQIGVKKVDLIISRMMGPVAGFEAHPVILDRVFRQWYELLAENGLIFVQFAEVAQKDLEKKAVTEWAEVVRSEFPEIDIRVDDGVLRLHKKKGSPEKLPKAIHLFNTKNVN